MKPNTTLKLIGAIVIAIIIFYSFLSGEKLPYEEQIRLHRAEVDDFMKNDGESPIPDSLRLEFQGLNYFEPDANFKVKASLETIPGNPKLQVPTSDGVIREYTKHAIASFVISGNQYQVILLRHDSNSDEEGLFLPFADLTNNVSTYGGGRYLDLGFTDKSSITIDFNLAYNPYCVYSPTYSCPLPPADNRLAVAITAGEKNFE